MGNMGSFVDNMISSISNSVPTIISVLCAIIFGICVFIIYQTVDYKSNKKKLTKINKLRLSPDKPIKITKKRGYFKSLHGKLEDYFKYRAKVKSEYKEYAYWGIIGTEVLIFVVALVLKKPIFAFALPPLFHVFILCAIDIVTVRISHIVLDELPNLIKHIIKIFSKTSDLKTVIYEASHILEEPLKGMFFNLSRRMISENYEKCLNAFADDINDIWMYALIFLLLSYREQSKKEDIIKNLRTLADIMDKENYTRKKALADRKPATVLNYTLLILGLAAFMLNMAFNPYGQDFFNNSMTGTVCIVIGIAGAFGTILINLLLTHNSEGR